MSVVCSFYATSSFELLRLVIVIFICQCSCDSCQTTDCFVEAQEQNFIIPSCAGGWCTRERQHRQWRNGQPWASGSSGWWTFLRRRWARGRMLVEMLFGRRKDGVSQDFPTAFAKSQASLGNFLQSRAPSESGPTIAINHQLQSVGHYG